MENAETDVERNHEETVREILSDVHAERGRKPHPERPAPMSPGILLEELEQKTGKARARREQRRKRPRSRRAHPRPITRTVAIDTRTTCSETAVASGVAKATSVVSRPSKLSAALPEKWLR